MASPAALFRCSNVPSRVPEPHFTIYFDGVCHLCNGFVRFILHRDQKGLFQFVPLQSPLAAQRLHDFKLTESAFSTVVLAEGERIFTESTAALRIARHLGGVWAIAYGFILVPAFLRDAVYRWVARHRYRIFGRNDQCMIPRPEWKDRFPV